jgi:prepilin-type N-terminal cleavage/methylation domain-containing protein
MERRKKTHCGAHSREGFTLTELIVAIALMSVIVSTLFFSLSTTQQTVSITTRNAELVDSVAQMFELLHYDLSAAIPPRTDHADVTEPGYIFIIRNHSKAGLEGNFDELWFSTTYTRGGGMFAKTKNVRYFVYYDNNIKRHVLVRQELLDMQADTANPPPIETEEEQDGGNQQPPNPPVPATGRSSYEVLCGAVERFEVQYLSVKKNINRPECIPDVFLRGADDHPLNAEDFNFRNSAIWRSAETLHPDYTESSPRAINVIIVIRDYNGGDPYYFEHIFWLPNTQKPNMKWQPEE